MPLTAGELHRCIEDKFEQLGLREGFVSAYYLVYRRAFEDVYPSGKVPEHLDCIARVRSRNSMFRSTNPRILLIEGDDAVYYLAMAGDLYRAMVAGISLYELIDNEEFKVNWPYQEFVGAVKDTADMLERNSNQYAGLGRLELEGELFESFDWITSWLLRAFLREDGYNELMVQVNPSLYILQEYAGMINAKTGN